MVGSDWVVEPEKFLSPAEVKTLAEAARARARTACARGSKVSIRDRLIVELALATGLRVMEIARLNCGDVFVSNAAAAVLVRRGKGGRKRLVRFNGAFKQHFLDYILWKQAVGEPTGPDDPLLLSSNTGRHMTTRAIEKAFKRTAAAAGLPARYSIHCLRHTYACALYKASGYNLRLVQKQLGHARIATTQVYADVLDPDVERALDRLYR